MSEAQEIKPNSHQADLLFFCSKLTQDMLIKDVAKSGVKCIRF